MHTCVSIVAHVHVHRMQINTRARHPHTQSCYYITQPAFQVVAIRIFLMYCNWEDCGGGESFGDGDSSVGDGSGSGSGSENCEAGMVVAGVVVALVVVALVVMMVEGVGGCGFLSPCKLDRRCLKAGMQSW